MEFRVGDIIAKCSGCGGTLFEPLHRNASSGPHSDFRCASCKTQTSYSELIRQIGKEAARRSKERLTGSRKRVAEAARAGGTSVVPALILRPQKVSAS
jgi:hypothetical protein